MLVPWVLAGTIHRLHQPLDLPVFLQQMSTEGITHTVAPPPLLNMLQANEAMLESVDLSAVRMISSGSAPLAPWMVEGWQARGIEIVNGFGSNEGAAMLSTMAMVPDPSDRARHFPRPDRSGVKTRLVDLDSGAEITEAGTLGELRFAGTLGSMATSSRRARNSTSRATTEPAICSSGSTTGVFPRRSCDS
ncbi:MAG: long-chain fatty acid--CoA ligase [Actinomycetia bacterium]|nr:long-chain fatty acid--CoA ligase [Actinomycetes bacterium]